ncbi:uncharacterized protein LOC117650369 [Thrips palmi]|uniref:Uncharacterized protein LOC117650369 n=1 Tax=Thrips palmi TaxID=161013 RepID=A0A6P8ZW82_THRPL|nr:uncharacterized protein LOC117650369 [Thrips palmi]
MVKKEASKGREWEKGRRDVLNQTFCELQKALPSYIDGQIISKKNILIQALGYIQQLQQEKKNGGEEGNQEMKLEVLQKWTLHVLQKFSQLLSLIDKDNIKVPIDFLKLLTPPAWISPEISKSISKIEKFGANNNVTNKKQKIAGKRKGNTSLSTTSASSNSMASSTINTKVEKPVSLVKVAQFQSDSGDPNSGQGANSSILQSNPLLMQSSPLQMSSQLLFASNSSSTPLPLLVSVTGVKTVNPFILVQSNVVTPSPLSGQKVVSSGMNNRPIQPGPPNKTSKKLRKLPIPSLKQCGGHRNISVHGKSKLLKQSSKVDSKPCPQKTVKIKNVSQDIQSVDSEPVQGAAAPDENGLKSTMTSAVSETKSAAQKQPANILLGSEGKCSQPISDVNKENVAENSLNSKCASDETKLNVYFTSSNKDEAAGTELLSTLENPKEAPVVENEEISTLHIGQQLKKNDSSAQKLMDCEKTPVKKRLCEMDINSAIFKRQKCAMEDSSMDGSKIDKTSATDCHLSHISTVEVSPVKTSKSSYSILALCEGQHLFSETGLTSEATDQIVQEISTRRSSEQDKEVTDGGRMGILIHQQVPIEKPNDVCSNTEKSRQASTTNTYSEWSDKIKYKSDRLSSSGNIFSSVPLHNNKNTFIPISDMENFKAVPESFDSTDASFGLPMHSSDISNDIFASLQVPTAGQHPESISPTAAFLLSFPLVSTSKATELLADDTVCENTDSQPGIKTILQIGNMDCDTPVTKCVTEFSPIEGSNVVYSTSNIFSHDTVPLAISKNKSSVDNRNFAHKGVDQISSHKCANTGTLLSLKETANFAQKHMEPTSKCSHTFSSKSIYQPPCDSSKQICQSRNESASSSVTSNGNGVQHDVSRMQSKHSGAHGISNKASQKPNDSTPFLICEKQTDWMDVPHSTYSDFSTLSASRSDCAVNYVLPPVLMSSGISVEDSSSATKCQAPSSSAGLVSWSTLAPENNQGSKQVSRLGHFQDMFTTSKTNIKSAEFQVSDISIGSSASSQSQVASTSLAVTKMNTVVSNFEQNHHLMNLPSHGSKPSASSASGSDLKKSFSISDRKQEECSTLNVMNTSSNVPSSNTTDRGRFNETESGPNLRQQTSLSTSATVGYTLSEAKQSKTSNIYFEDRSSKSLKPSTSITLENVGSKESINLMNYNQNAVVSELKQSLVGPSYESLNVKGNEVNNHHLQGNISKLHVAQNNEYPVAPSSTNKKNVIDFNVNSDLSVDAAKSNISGQNFNLESSTNVMQFSNSALNVLTNHQESYSNKSADRESQMKSQQQCARSTNKESVSNLHRPPVNWMTAPDIRSHQHHSGPSFGNNSNLNSTQGLLYLPDHTKDSDSTATLFDQSSNFHCLDIPHSGQSLFKGNELHLFGNETVENFHDSSAWSPNKNGGSSMLGNMMIPSTLPTLVGDLALGDTNISRPFLPSYSNDTQSCHKKSVKRSIITSRRSEKPVEESVATGQECGGSFLSVSQLVDSGNGSKTRTSSSTKESNIPYSGSFSHQDTTGCQSLKQNSKPVSSNYSTEALLSSSNAQQTNQHNHRKRRSHSAHYSNNFVGGTVSYQNNSSISLQVQGPQTQFLTDLPPHRQNDYQGTFLPSDGVHSFMLGNPSRTHRNQSYPLQNISDRSSMDDNLLQKNHNSTGMTDTSVSRNHRSNAINPINNTSSTVPSNIIDFGYMNMPPPVSQDDINFSNHPPAPSFLSHHSYPMPSQDSLYTTPRLTIHAANTHQNSTIQSPSATTLTNFHLSTIFPEINDKVIC